jgi:hypothetical protein
MNEELFFTRVHYVFTYTSAFAWKINSNAKCNSFLPFYFKVMFPSVFHYHDYDSSTYWKVLQALQYMLLLYEQWPRTGERIWSGGSREVFIKANDNFTWQFNEYYGKCHFIATFCKIVKAWKNTFLFVHH